MEREEKISKIEEIFHDNVVGLNKIEKKPEHESVLFSLLIGDKVVGIDIQKSFIDNKTIQEIEAYFSERHIYHSILSDKSSDLNGIFVDINDPICREMFQR